jgi:flagellar protein FliS
MLSLEFAERREREKEGGSSMNAYARSADTYLTQRILGASPEQQAALIMEAGQLHLGKAIQALVRKDMVAAAGSFIRVSEVLQEATNRLNLEDGNELAQNLKNLYDFWSKEILVASQDKNKARLEAVVQGMGEIRQAWEQLHERNAPVTKSSDFRVGDRVV